MSTFSAISAKSIPDEMVYRAAAIGVEEVNIKIEEFAKAGLHNFAIADLQAPRTMKRSVKICVKIIRELPAEQIRMVIDF